MPKETYEVGYKKPPSHTKFRKGQSGNAKGRPKGSKNMLTILEDALNEKVSITENGQRKEISKKEAIGKQMVNKATSGDFRSIKYLISELKANGLFADSQSEANSEMDVHNEKLQAEARVNVKKFLDDYASLKRRCEDIPPVSEPE